MTAVDQLGLDLGAQLTTLLRRVYVDLMGAAHGDAQDALGFEAAFDVELAEVQDVLDQVATRARGISETTRAQIQDLVGKAAAEGWSNERLAEEILKVGRMRSKVRAKVIAVTESAYAYSQGSLVAYLRSGVVGKVQWLTAPDEQVCKLCKPLDGKTVALGREFAPGVTAPPRHPLCRCVVLPVVDPLGTDVAPEPEAGEAETPAQAQLRLIRAKEDTIRSQRYESAYAVAADGAVLIDKDGQQYSVAFDDAEIEALRGKGVIFTHNHPRGWDVPETDPRRIGNSFSPEDIGVACSAEVAEIRAVTPMRRYWMRPPPEGWDMAYWRGTLLPTRTYYNNEVRAEFLREIRRGTMTPEEAEAQHNHEVWLRVTRDLGIPYGYDED